ncbi:MAG TPA: hypothetical protein VMX97_08685 [Hyphomicrobiaceae bacterium]|nr:hypothetical protein [Hyphomicrobiaceae bacterium]
MSANIRETVIAWGMVPQVDIATANVVGNLWRLNKVNATLATMRLNTESDAEDLGKGHEFATQLYKTSWDVNGTIEKYLSSEAATWAFIFGLGGYTESPAKTYTIKPLDPVTEGIELPTFSFIEAMRQSGDAVFDRMAVGCAVEGFTVTINSGPGRANSKIAIDFVGSGKITEPSGLVIPEATAEHLLPSASVVATINGADYVTDKNLVSLEFGWKNNLRLDSGFYPGSGFQETGVGSSGAIRGRLEYGNRVAFLRFVARFEHDSDELAQLKTQVPGTAVFSLTDTAADTFAVTFGQVTFATAQLGDTDGIVTVAVECSPQYETGVGVLGIVSVCTTAGIGYVTP